MQDKRRTIRISATLDNRIAVYCAMNHIENMSDFFRQAAVDKITPDVSDKALVFESLKDVHEKIHKVASQQNISFAFFCFFIKHFFLYNGELPIDQLEAAALSAKEQYKSFFEGFKKEIKTSPSLFESLLADYFEEKV